MMNRDSSWLRLVAVVCMSFAMVATAEAQRGGGGGRGGFGGGAGGFGGRGGSSSVGFVLRADVQKELGLKESDIEDLKEVVEEAQQKSGELRQELFADLREMSREERTEAMAEMQEEAAKLAKKARKNLFAELSSSQQKRYAELEFQYQIQQGNASAALQAVDIELSESDKEKLADVASEIREEIRKKTAELSRQLYAEALGKVVDKDVAGLMGKAFAFESTRQQFGRGGAPGGGRGGATGGGRGGRQRGGDDNNGRGNRRRPSSDDDDSESENPRRR